MNYNELPMINFRDLGGIPTVDGRHVKAHCFYRGGPIDATSPEGQKQVDALHLRHIIDLRSKGEIEHHHPDYISQGAEYHWLSANRAQHEKLRDDLNMLNKKTDESIEEWLLIVYKDLPLHNPAYQAVFDFMLKEEVPLYFHCSAGKDRTGVCAALILLLLGVSKEEVFKDYLRSYDEMMRLPIPHNRPSLVFKEWLEEAFKSIESYPSYEEFFEREYHLSLQQQEKLKQLYLV